jgi:hypothetical protein
MLFEIQTSVIALNISDTVVTTQVLLRNCPNSLKSFLDIQRALVFAG